MENERIMLILRLFGDSADFKIKLKTPKEWTWQVRVVFYSPVLRMAMQGGQMVVKYKKQICICAHLVYFLICFFTSNLFSRVWQLSTRGPLAEHWFSRPVSSI